MRARFFAIVLAALLGAVVLGSATAGAVDNPAYTSPPPSTVITTPPSVVPVQRVATAVTVRPVRSQLAITGSDVGQTALVGGVLLFAGVAVLVVRRRTSAA